MSLPVFKEGIQIGDDPIYLRPNYIDLSGGELRNVGYINQINTLNNLLNVVNIGNIDHVDFIYADKINAKTISNIEKIVDVGILEADLIQNVEQIKNVGILSSDTINVGTIGSVSLINAENLSVDYISDVQFLSAINATINTISNVSNLYATNADIQNISNVDNITAVNANLSTIQNVTKGYFLDASINILSYVNTAYIVSATINAGTFSDVTIATATLDLALFRDATIQNVNISAGDIHDIVLYDSSLQTCTISAGKIESVLISNCTLTGLTIDVATISNLQVIGEIQGDNIITANNIQNLAVRFDHLESGLQNVIGSTLWEAETDLYIGTGGAIVNDPTASSGKAVQCTILSSPDWFVYGPYKTLPPGDYNVHFRVKGEKIDSEEPYFALIVQDYSEEKVLAAKTLTFKDVYYDFPDWRVLTVLAPNIPRGHSIQVGVKTESNHTLSVDYVKLEPAGAFANYPFYFQIDTDQIKDFAITSSKIGSFQIYSHHIQNFQIKNSHIDTLQITYDRLVKPPIGWNEVINPSFEYGSWEKHSGAANPFYRNKVEAHSGTWSLRVPWLFSTPSNSYGNMSELIPIRTSEDSVVVSAWVKASLDAGYTCVWIRFYDANRNQISWDEIYSLHGPADTEGWKLGCRTLAIPDNAAYARVGCWANTLVQALIYVDDFSLVFGDQYTGFVDTTVARNRWIPDTYFSKETVTFNFTSNKTVSFTLPVTIDYKAKAIVFAGANVGVGATVDPHSETGAYAFVRLSVDGQRLAFKTVSGRFWNDNDSSMFYYLWHDVSFADEATLAVGPHTFVLEIGPYSFYDNISVNERYIRVVLGQFFTD